MSVRSSLSSERRLVSLNASTLDMIFFCVQVRNDLTRSETTDEEFQMWGVCPSQGRCTASCWLHTCISHILKTPVFFFHPVFVLLITHLWLYEKKWSYQPFISETSLQGGQPWTFCLFWVHLSTNSTNGLHPGEYLSSYIRRAEWSDLMCDSFLLKRFFPPQLPLTCQVFTHWLTTGNSALVW